MNKQHSIESRNWRNTFLVLAMLAALPGAAVPEAFANGPPSPVGPEFQVNTTTAGNQEAPAIAMDANGNFVVVWQSDTNGLSPEGIYAQRYNTAGMPQGTQLPRINTIANSLLDKPSPAVAMDKDGNFVVVWQHNLTASDIYARRYDKNGNAQDTSEFRVNTYTTGKQINPAVAMDANGNFVVVWQSPGQDGDDYGIFAQRYNAAGAPLGAEFQVNTTTPLDQFNPAVAMDTNGNFVVVWLNEVETGSANVYAQFYNAEGNPQGPELQVTVPFFGVATNCPCLAVAMDASDNFVVAWVPSSLSDIIYARRYSITNGAPQAQGPEFPVSTSNGRSPTVAMDASGNFVVNWLKLLRRSGSSWDIYARRYDKNGNALDTPEFRVNTYPAANDYDWLSTAVAMNSPSNFKIVWQSYDDDNGGIAGQRYALACRNAAFRNPLPVISDRHTDTTSTPPEAPAGIFRFTATFCNHGALPLSDLVSRTVTIAHTTGSLSNHLLNRHYGPTGTPPGDGMSPSSEGSVLDFPANNNPPLNNGYNDYVLAVGECVDVKYEIGLRQRKPFNFFVDIYGDDANLPGSSVTGTPCP